VAVGVIKATTPKEAAGVTTKAAQKVIYFLSSCDAVLLVYLSVDTLVNSTDPDPDPIPLQAMLKKLLFSLNCCNKNIGKLAKNL